MENIYVQFNGMVYQQIVGIPMGTNCAPLIADPREDAGGLSREYVLRIPSVS